MPATMDLDNVSRVNQFYSEQRDLGSPSVIRGVVIQKRDTLKAIKREIAQLVEREKRIEEELVRLGIALAPHNHNVLPNEILGRVFILVAQAHGPVYFPIPKGNLPPQLAISHVCYHWRKVALHTAELWGHTQLAYPQKYHPDHVVRLHQRWLLRAASFPVKVSISFDGSFDRDEIASALQKIVLPLQVKRLGLDLTCKELMALSTLPETALPGLMELELSLTPSEEVVNMNNPPHFITRLRSVTFMPGSETGVWFDQLSPSLPWGQLRFLGYHMFMTDFHPILNILRQLPTLQVLHLSVFKLYIAELEEHRLSMPSLRDIILDVDMNLVDGIQLDRILRSFACPSLTKFTLLTEAYWTSETFQIIKQQYNMQQIQELDFSCNFALPVSSLLRDAPMLRSLSSRDAIMDDEAIYSISNGTLGRFLRKLNISAAGDVGELLSMVEARKKRVDELIESGYSWKEEMTILKDVAVRGERREEYNARVVALKEAGITIRFVY
ncbi:hypothetical protein F5887DRAFT_1079101 [Amanita rubescens]|nr:hypothetical protein F5887DRAFT_1079101 [Amanita rubescens]